MKNEIKVNIDGSIGWVPREKYANAKLKQLQEFGYSNLTMGELQSQIDAIHEGKELDVIGMFMEGEVLPLKP